MAETTENKWTPSGKQWTPAASDTDANTEVTEAIDNSSNGNETSSGAADKLKLKLEERKLRFEEIKDKHRMELEVRRQSFLEMQINRDWELENISNKDASEHWVKSYWRPAAGWLYMMICFMDFVGFPAIYTFLPIINHAVGVPINFVAWSSLTLSNGGLFHLAFGAILGIAAWSRGQEKIAQQSSSSTGSYAAAASGGSFNTSTTSTGSSDSGKGFNR